MTKLQKPNEGVRSPPQQKPKSVPKIISCNPFLDKDINEDY
jgi:hypothetical protein